MFRPSGLIVLPFGIKKSPPGLSNGVSVGKIFSMGVNCMSLAVWLGEDREMFCGCSRFRFGVSVIHGTAVFIEWVF